MSQINPNGIMALVAGRIHSNHAAGLLSSMNKLATGQRINRGADDPAGLIISENLRAMLAAIEAESRSLQRTSSVAASAEGALSEVSSMLNEANALVVANANTAGMSEAERQANQLQIDSILASVDRIAGSASFNGQSLLDGSLALTAGETRLTLPSIATHNLGAVDVDGKTYTLADLASGGALNAVTGNLEAAQQAIAAAQQQVTTVRGEIGAFQRHTVNAQLDNLAVTMQNVASANSMIRDTDFASETANFSRLWLLERSALRVMSLVDRNAHEVLGLLG